MKPPRALQFPTEGACFCGLADIGYICALNLLKWIVMEMNDYQRQAAASAIYPRTMRGVYPTLGLTGEAGEVAEKVKKVIRDHGGEFSEEAKLEIAKELGDVMWYVAAIAGDLGFSLEQIAQLNLEKLASRQSRNRLHGSGDNR